MRTFLQTIEWLEFQKEAGHKVWRFPSTHSIKPQGGEIIESTSSGQVDDGPTSPNGFEGRGKITANIIKLGLPLGKSFLYIPHGPEIDFEHVVGGVKNELSNFVKYLKDLAREEKSIFVKIEPFNGVVMELLYRKGIRRSSKQIQPYKTVILDLNLPEEHLLGKMHQKTRYNINLSEKKGLVLEESDDVDIFWKLLKQTAKKDQFSTHPKEYYEKMLDFFRDGKELRIKLFLVKYGDKHIGGAIIMFYGDIAYYLHGAMDREYRSLMAPYFMHWEIIKKLKVKGFRFYDFWGIDSNKWPGVTRFKLGWGGDLKEYPGSFDMPVSRLWYFAYSLARKIL